MRLKHYKGADLGENFKRFYKLETNRIATNLRKLGCTKIKFSMQFYYFYGIFVSKSGQTYYISCSDVRHFGYEQLMYRKTSYYGDLGSGSVNQYISTDRGELKHLKLK